MNCMLWPLLALGFLQADSVPVANPEAACAVLPINADAQPDLAILDARRLLVALAGSNQPPRLLDLPPEASAIDLFDLNNDGAREAIIVAGDGYFRAAITASGTTPALEELFRAPSQFSAGPGQPFFQVLGVTWDSKPLLVVPTETEIELRGPDGSVATRFPLDPQRARGEWVQPFAAWPAHPPQLAPPGGLEWRVSHVVDYSPLLPEALAPAAGRTRDARRGTSTQAREASQLEPSFWPWFPLMHGPAPSETRVLYALEAPKFDTTLIRLRQLEAPGEAVGPIRRFPGQLVHLPSGAADFDGDGYHDLLLLRAEPPPPSFDALSQTIMSGTWPVALSAHLFDAVHGRYSAEAASRLAFTLPLAWALSAGPDAPLRNIAIGDLDGDGRADLGMSLNAREYAVWRWKESGFSRSPDFSFDAPEPLIGLAFADPRGAQEQLPAIVLRGAQALYVLRVAAAFRD